MSSSLRAGKGKSLRDKGFLALGAVLLAFMVFAFLTYAAGPASHPVVAYAVNHHAEIMAALVVVAVAFGFALAQRFYRAYEKEREGSQDILRIALLFLSTEEKAIVQHLVTNGGSTNQAEIARLPGMNRVKAHRSLQKMQERRLIELIPHGKMRKVRLKETLRELLAESGKLEKQAPIQ
jgi:uncharacterized membrane protein